VIVEALVSEVVELIILLLVKLVLVLQQGEIVQVAGVSCLLLVKGRRV
jgi:hypothetical protein